MNLHFQVTPDEVRGQRSPIVGLAESTETAHDTLAALGGAGAAAGDARVIAALDGAIDAWRNVANQFASSIHDYAEATGQAADLYDGAEAASMAVEPLEAPEPTPAPILMGP